MKNRLLAAALLLFTCGGCVGYYHDPYAYSYYDPYPYPYGPYYTPYRSPALYADPGWLLFSPYLYFDFNYHGGHGGHHHGGGHHHR